MSPLKVRDAIFGARRIAGAARFSTIDLQDARGEAKTHGNGFRKVSAGQTARTARRILYVHSTLQPPPTDLQTDRFYLLSDKLEGDVLQPIWFQTPEEVEARFGTGSYPVYTVGKFRYHWCLSPVTRRLRDRLSIFWFYIKKGLELHRECGFDCIVAYSHMTTGLIAGVVKLLTGARLIIEIVTSPHLVYITHNAKPSPGSES